MQCHHARNPLAPAVLWVSLCAALAPAPARSEPSPPAAAPAPRASARIFVSGHSLTDDPLGEDIVSIARSLRLKASFNEQIVLGSPIRVRVRGMNPAAADYPGYRTGKNRDGARDMDVLRELHTPRTVDGAYDVLLITERHDLMNVLVWEDTVRYLRHFHDRLVEREPRGQTFLYQAWQSVSNLEDPKDWIAVEREMGAAWSCVAERVNTSLAAEGKPQAIVTVPTGDALVALVDRALAGGIPALRGDSPRTTLRRIFTDDVHLTREGVHFMALVSFATIFGRSPVGATPPLGMNAALARQLQELAWEVVSSRKPQTRGLPACRKLMRERLCAASSQYRKQPGELGPCQGAFDDKTRTGPFHYDAKMDASYWLPPP
jgi:hypothetical protein